MIVLKKLCIYAKPPEAMSLGGFEIFDYLFEN